ncbi:hypothetical protein DFH08DRAFT_431739 [Mycena albidolilacea]|uniref:Uncharacterized protein n=1 Tax=Mycena albidolilacea TaxID=1033008 RepID=A0AAD7EDA0_9AGAR|nr:hypothetical protein DFH08DRAFT_431739 [Mycena albidolilacea]
MKFTLLSATMLACVTTVLGANTCTAGLYYCGDTIKALPDAYPVGWYYGAAEQATYDAGIPDPRGSTPDVLFECTTDINFLKVVKNCGLNRCITPEESGKDAYCV